jgi:transcriptional regulator with XRE-family HTH domain
MLKDADIATHIGTRMRQRRKTMGFKQSALADQLSVTHRQVCRYENGRSQISAAKLVKVGEFLMCPVSFFFEGLGAGPPDDQAQVERLSLRLSRLPARINGVRFVGPTRLRGWRIKRRALALASRMIEEGQAEDA